MALVDGETGQGKQNETIASKNRCLLRRGERAADSRYRERTQMSTLSVRVRKARSLVRLSQAELARRIGVKRSAVTQWENPEGTTPSVDHLIQIALLTSTNFEWLATGRGPSCSEVAEPASVIVDDYARDEYESRMLTQLRLMPMMKRRMALDIIGVLAR